MSSVVIKLPCLKIREIVGDEIIIYLKSSDPEYTEVINIFNDIREHYAGDKDQLVMPIRYRKDKLTGRLDYEAALFTLKQLGWDHLHEYDRIDFYRLTPGLYIRATVTLPSFNGRGKDKDKLVVIANIKSAIISSSPIDV